MPQVVSGILLSVIFSILGFVLLFIGYRIFDLLTPMDLSKRIFEDGNLAAGVMAGAFVLALAIVVAAAIHG